MNYEDIISLPHPTSRRHPRMSLADRAAQFAPFAALKGFGDEIDRTRLEQLEAEARKQDEDFLDTIC